VQAALDEIRRKDDGSWVKPASVNTYVGFAHRVGYTRFNAAPLIKVKKAPGSSRSASSASWRFAI
jgi:hypothetical protein